MANSATKFLARIGTMVSEVFAVSSSAGAADADKVPALKAQGQLDMTMLNAKALSAGGGDAGKIVLLDGTGKIDASMLPAATGLADQQAMTASEALAAGDYVNIFEQSANVFRVRKADATVAGKHAMGFVKAAAIANQVDGTMVYFEGKNDVVSGQTAGDVFLQTTPGKGGPNPPAGNNNVFQKVGFATTATSVNFQAGDPITIKV